MKAIITFCLAAFTLLSCGKDVLGEGSFGTVGPYTEKNNSHDPIPPEPIRTGLEYHDAFIQLMAENMQSSTFGAGKLKVWGRGVTTIDGYEADFEIKMLFNSDGRLITGGMVIDPDDAQVDFIFQRGYGSLPHVLRSLSGKLSSYYDGANPSVTSRVIELKFKNWENLQTFNELLTGATVTYECAIGLIPADAN